MNEQKRKKKIELNEEYLFIGFHERWQWIWCTFNSSHSHCYSRATRNGQLCKPRTNEFINFALAQHQRHSQIKRLYSQWNIVHTQRFIPISKHSVGLKFNRRRYIGRHTAKKREKKVKRKRAPVLLKHVTRWLHKTNIAQHSSQPLYLYEDGIWWQWEWTRRNLFESQWLSFGGNFFLDFPYQREKNCHLVQKSFDTEAGCRWLKPNELMTNHTHHRQHNKWTEPVTNMNNSVAMHLGAWGMPFTLTDTGEPLFFHYD